MASVVVADVEGDNAAGGSGKSFAQFNGGVFACFHI